MKRKDTNTEQQDDSSTASSGPVVLDKVRNEITIRANKHPHAGHRKRLRQSAKNDVELNAFSDVELIELLLSFFIPQKDTNVLAHKLIDRYGTVEGVLNAQQSELIKFENITAQVAAILPLLYALCMPDGQPAVKLKNRADAADFFGVVYLGKNTVGTYVAFMDDDLNVIAIECLTAKGIPERAILCSACKYNCKYAFIARREIDLFPETYNIAEEVGALAELLRAVGVCMLDYLIFTDYGYYTVGAAPQAEGWYPIYIFVPAIKYARSPEMYGIVAGNNAMYVGMEVAELPPVDLADLCAAVKPE